MARRNVKRLPALLLLLLPFVIGWGLYCIRSNKYPRKTKKEPTLKANFNH